MLPTYLYYATDIPIACYIPIYAVPYTSSLAASIRATNLP